MRLKLLHTQTNGNHPQASPRTTGSRDLLQQINILLATAATDELQGVLHTSTTTVKGS